MPHCLDCGDEYTDKLDECPNCDSERIVDLGGVSEFIQEEVEEDMREKLQILPKEYEEGLVSEEESNKVMEKEAEKLMDQLNFIQWFL